MKSLVAKIGLYPLAILFLCFFSTGSQAFADIREDPREERGDESARETVSVEGLRKPALVIREGNGLPHIVAFNDHDLYFLQGWIHAEDRFFQMDRSRRQADGTLAELLGPLALQSDVLVRPL